MPLITACIGLATKPLAHSVDARWTMAYAASLGDLDAIYLDTCRAEGVRAHPLFNICPEWPVALASRDLLRERGLNLTEFSRGVHATHDTHLDRLIRPGDELTTQATILAIESRKPGAYVTSCFDTYAQHGERVCRTFHGMLFRDVEVMSVNKAAIPDKVVDIAIPSTPHEALPLSTTVQYEQSLEIAANLAHVYTDCARIYNPIHTDAAVAQSAGLPAIILHGSATLALAVSAIINRFAGADPTRVKRIAAQFRGMVLLPSSLTLRCYTPLATEHVLIVPFDIFGPDGNLVVHRGSVSLSSI